MMTKGKSDRVPRQAGRQLFGRIAQTYDKVRLTYPEEVYDILSARCGLRKGTRTFEVGPGTGIATRELLKRGAGPLALIEPNRQMVAFLRRRFHAQEARLEFQVATFERARLPAGAFDLGVAATSFHWVQEARGLRKVGRLLRPGGWWAMWGNRHGDPDRRNTFQEAIDPLYREILGRTDPMPSRFGQRIEKEKVLRAIDSTDLFEKVRHERIHWAVRLPTARIVTLWGTFSDILVLPPKLRARFLTELERILDEEFGGRAEVRMVTPIATARRI